jgi:uncharacterized RDD family membrane protein YckC
MAGIATGPGTPSFVRRFLAYLFDVLPITLAVAFVFNAFWGLDEVVRDRFQNPDDIGARVRFLFQRNLVRELSAALWIIYCALFEASRLRGSPGKFLQGLQVVNWNGEAISARQAWIRNGSKIISVSAVFIGFIWAAFDKHGQAWHDKIAQTYVVRR